jgi:hypothetical protein
MSERRDQIAAARALGQAGFDAESMTALLTDDVGRWQLRPVEVNTMRRAIGLFAGTLQGLPGDRLADRWATFEQSVWPQWTAGRDRPSLGRMWTWGVWAAVGSRSVQPSWPLLSTARVSQMGRQIPSQRSVTGVGNTAT